VVAPSPSRRAVLASGLGFVAGGCFDVPTIANLPGALRYGIFGHPAFPIERAAIAKLPYATMRAKIGRGQRSLVVLGRRDGPALHWFSADRVVLVTRAGRLVKTAGLPRNIRATQFRAGDPVDRRLHELRAPVRATRIVDFDDDSGFGMPIDSRFESLGPRVIAILDIDFDTVLVREHNTSRTRRWSFENLYWVDPVDGFVWKSLQHIVRDYPPIEMEILKPAS
jgi:hypothetical protein